MLDVVIPAYNEERRIGTTLHAYATKIIDPDVRFIVAVDGGDDGTAQVVGEFAAQDPRVELHEFPRLGKGGVLMEAFRICDAELISFVDADRATPPEELMRLVDANAASDIAIATRRHPSSVVPVRRSLSRRIASSGFAFGIRTLFRLPYGDTQCGAKVLRREALKAVLPYLSSRDFLFDVDLLMVARSLGLRVVEVPTIWIDQEGSTVRAGSDARKMAASALRLWIHHKTLPVPSRDRVETSINRRAGLDRADA